MEAARDRGVPAVAPALRPPRHSRADPHAQCQGRGRWVSSKGNLKFQGLVKNWGTTAGVFCPVTHPAPSCPSHGHCAQPTPCQHPAVDLQLCRAAQRVTAPAAPEFWHPSAPASLDSCTPLPSASPDSCIPLPMHPQTPAPRCPQHPWTPASRCPQHPCVPAALSGAAQCGSQR